MSEKVSKPGDLDKFVPTKATVPNFTIQSQDTTVANVVEQASQVVEQAFSSFNKFLDENAKVVSEMPKWKQEAYKVVPDTPETTDKFIPSYSMNEMIYPQDADIKHPKHYTSHPSGVECITIVQHHNFNTGNAIKYLWRAGLKVPAGKNETEAAIKDLQKAKEYIEFEIRRLTT